MFIRLIYQYYSH